MKTILKYTLSVIDEQIRELPKGSTILCVKNQSGHLVLYALVDSNEKQNETKIIKIFGTGHPIDISTSSWVYLDTVMTHDDQLVWHIYYK